MMCQDFRFSLREYIMFRSRACALLYALRAEADLGMLSMFGRKGTPTKMGPPHEDQKNYCRCQSVTP